MKVLVIDDNAVNRRYVKSVIEDGNISVLEADNGKSGISMAQNIQPDLILVDIQMPDMDGFKCLEALKNSQAISAPILAITAYSSPKDRQNFISKGFRDYITKPVKPNVLSSTIGYWLNENNAKNHEEKGQKSLVFDSSSREELLKHIGPEALAELYKEFQEEMNSFINDLNTLNSSKKFYDICSILHTIKGNAGSLGFMELSDLANQLETNIKIGRTDCLTEELQQLKQYTKQLFINYETQLNLNL